MTTVKQRAFGIVIALSVGLFGLTLPACKMQPSIIQKVTVTPSANLESVRVSMVFSSSIQSDLAGGFSILDYGYLFVNPFTPSQPFEIGFDLNTEIVNEQDFIALNPTTVLPNGMPIGLPQAVVEIRSPSPIHSKFDLYGYVDVLNQSWLGIAAMFGFVSDAYFPAGLSVSQSFLNDEAGAPAILASVFGPTLNSDGTLLKSGGIALFADVRRLIDDARKARDSGVTDPVLEYFPAGEVRTEGKEAASYARDPQKLRRLEENLIRGFAKQPALPRL